MSPAPLAKKLGIKPNTRMLIRPAPPGYLESLAPLPDEAQVAREGDSPFPFMQIFIKEAADLESLGPKLLTEAGEDALVWITYRKVSSKLAGGLSRDEIRRILSTLGWRAVAIVAIDEVWSALRFRPKQPRCRSWVLGDNYSQFRGRVAGWWWKSIQAFAQTNELRVGTKPSILSGKMYCDCFRTGDRFAQRRLTVRFLTFGVVTP